MSALARLSCHREREVKRIEIQRNANSEGGGFSSGFAAYVDIVEWKLKEKEERKKVMQKERWEKEKSSNGNKIKIRPCSRLGESS